MLREAMHLSHPERVVFPDRGATKRDIADYYVAVMPWLLPEIINRPLSIVRCSEGTDNACFFQRHHTAGLSEVDEVALEEESGQAAGYLVVRNPESVLQLVQFNTIEFHPWGSTAEDPDRADRVVFDLDPGEGVAWLQLVAAAKAVRDRLARDSMRSFVRTSGGKGLHVLVPLKPACDWTEVKAWARAIASGLADEAPDRYVATAAKRLRGGRIFIDYLRNYRSATSVASYSLRARPGAPVAAPLTWAELESARKAIVHDIGAMQDRLARLARDPWEGIDDVTQQIGAGGTEVAGKKARRRKGE
jgi:bifunctional non-homologous end joining protein LigD